MKLFDIMEQRRSNYDLTDKLSLSEDQLNDLLAQALQLAPTGFNSQSPRIVLALGQRHRFLWDTVLAGIKREIGETEAFEKSKQKIADLSNSAGTILFFEDEAIDDDLKQRFPLYAQNISTWAQQSQGMLQLTVWTALAEAGMGASLQHYSELIEADIKEAWNINPQWRLIGQMPFGVPSSMPSPKKKIPGQERMLVLK